MTVFALNRLNSLLSLPTFHALVARARDPRSRRVKKWYHSRNDGQRREASCSLCGKWMGSWCGRYPMTKCVWGAIVDHECAPWEVREGMDAVADVLLDLTGDAMLANVAARGMMEGVRS